MTDHLRRCPACHAPRMGLTCHKCGAETFVPHPSWMEPYVPDVAPIREAARACGYAIGEHGTKERDLDLIAAPWVDVAVDPDELVTAIAAAIDGRIVGGPTTKPLGRKAYTILKNGWFKPIDISVCQRARP